MAPADVSWYPVGNTFDGIVVDSTHTVHITNPTSKCLRIRFRFQSNDAWSDEDGLYDSDGAILIDNLVIRDSTGTVVALEDFEDEAPGAIETEDWRAPMWPTFGDYAGLFWGGDVVQEDGCGSDLSCFWAFFEGSTYNYACGGHPQQMVVPWGDAVLGYMQNEVWSPWIAWTGTGSGGRLEFDVYRDLPLDNQVVYTWRVRSMVDGCVARWRENTVSPYFYGGDRDWYRHRDDFGQLVRLDATEIQIAIGAMDMRGVWGWGSGYCHSHAPLIDNVTVYREPRAGPMWSVRDRDLFQDAFPRDGSLTGIGRADMANDPAHGYQEPEYWPGDSAAVYNVTDYNGLVVVGGPPYNHRAVYCYVSVAPPDTLKAGIHLENTILLGGLPRFPYRGMASAAGREWTQLNCDRRRNATGALLSNSAFCIDLPDDLFEAGDTIFYFFGAQNTLGEWSYWTREAGNTNTIGEAASLPLEFQILPGAGYLRGGDILYVDGMDGRGAQPYFDTAFARLGILDQVDRFDINGPSSGVSNRPGTRVYHPDQLIVPYRKIIWNTGDLRVTIGDGTGYPEKSNDWVVLKAFLDGLLANEEIGGLYLNGDDLPWIWDDQVGASAIAMRDYLHYSVPAGGGNHAPLMGRNPYGVGAPGGIFDHPLGPDTLVVYGGCPGANDFDYVIPEGAAVTHMTYEAMGASAAAVIGEKTSAGAGEVGILMSGFSFHYIRDDRPGEDMDRVLHLQGVLNWLGNNYFPGLDVRPTGYANALGQNYPNPFNPTTAITFTVKERTRVRLRIYDVTGALVRNLVDDLRTPGVTHEVRWDGRNEVGQSVASGVYFYRLVAKDFVRTKKMVVLK
jgi:hypothetical protein